MKKNPLVGIVMGSDSDLPFMEEAFRVLESFGVDYEAHILSAHRSPQKTSQYAREAAGRGLRILIAGAGWAAHLAGVLAAETILPVVGVPMASSPLQGLDALYATVQMPPGVPVASMAIGKGGAHNAALFAVQILALQDSALADKFRRHKEKMTEQIAEKDQKLQDRLANPR
ncbi:MAG: 5-(carboxyamino)imidazole ribonucleotide mutase [Desulforhabdus sp.]|nr:5-(carboxyamino)imidazole ribonucleotide mutase [Desulforhabdus sp.]